jgi:capsular polysaccharide biosynthesis protein
MELKEYYKIWRSQISVVIYAILIAVVIVYAWSVRESQIFSASLILNISRAETQPTVEYKYDQFYRLGADEKFADTIAEWLKSPGVAKDIFDKAGANSDQKTMRSLSKSFQAEKKSSEIVSLSFSSSSEDEAKKIATSVSSVISDKTKSLNADAHDQNWFQVETSNLVILKNTQDLRLNLSLAALAGLFVGTLLAFGKHYIREED